MALLHHWSQVTSVSILSTPKLDYYWQTLIPQVAFQHQYVMHSILSLAALHVAYLNPPERSSRLFDAAQHHTKALRAFTEDIKCVTEDNSDALFINAILTFFYAFLAFGKLHGEEASGSDIHRMDHTSRVLGTIWIPLVRGMRAVLHQVHSHVKDGPFRDLLEIGNWDELDLSTNSDPFDEQITNIREIWRPNENGEDGEAYSTTLDLLRRCRMWMAQFETPNNNKDHQWGYNRSWSGPFMWLLLSPPKYFQLLEQRQPPAMVIFAWFGASIYSLNGHWWIEGCGESIVDVVEQCLGSYWVPWTQWPRNLIQQH